MLQTQDSVLTERQRQVAALLTQHLSLKEIAVELSVSESAINKHISVLKQTLGARSRREIVAKMASRAEQITFDNGCRNSAGSFSHLPLASTTGQKPSGNDPGLIAFADAGAMLPRFEQSDDWARVFEPRIVPNWLDGEHAVLVRLSAVVVMLFAMLLLPIIGVATLDSLQTVIGN